MPVIFTITNFFTIFIVVKITNYSANGNLSILDDRNKEVAYLVFNKKLSYMSCNDYALHMFPELANWEIEKTIPGNGGRFNTFLRIPLMNYVNGNMKEKHVSEFEFDKKYYRIEICQLLGHSNKAIGYFIEVALDIVKTREAE